MERLNYGHLLYFWMVAREGTVARAAKQLRLAQPTLSGQIRSLEGALGEKLFERAGRGLRLSAMGGVVFRYADEIFTLGRELAETVKGLPTGRPLRLAVGVADALPKLVAYHLVEPALALKQPVRLAIRVASTQDLLAALALHELDVVLSDRVAPPTVSVRAFNHLLGECGVTLFAAARRALRFRKGFPRSLDRAPFLLPGQTSTLRRTLEQWFERQRIRPNVIGEFDDSTLIEVFGQAGKGIFATPSIVESSVRRQYDVAIVGRLDRVRERFYAVSAERLLKHPAVIAITESARRELFG
ncbi:MAG: transcriptional activator NhaR [Candidatus Eisenbacteria bacterium]|uniref:Transcriptional activator NhaR n=1 Tax=Eiseniibacteriota bacterium TaxID=2212470 RepID=A0A538U2J5_UNCEI|nr:MAG: transcriptional activator NhaR [Candidatus Eisenbacteria bacterium]